MEKINERHDQRTGRARVATASKGRIEVVRKPIKRVMKSTSSSILAMDVEQAVVYSVQADGKR